jgi:FtsH-binding integral membrane protein
MMDMVIIFFGGMSLVNAFFEKNNTGIFEAIFWALMAIMWAIIYLIKVKQ